MTPQPTPTPGTVERRDVCAVSVTILCSGRGTSDTAGGPETVARDLTTRLVRRAPDRVVHAGSAPACPGLAGTDVLVIGASVAGGDVDPAFGEALAAGDDLTGTVVLLVAVGPWPAEANTLERRLGPFLRRSGALCVSPALHVHGPSAPAIEAYCRYWGPALPGAVAAARHRRTAAAR